MAVQQPDNVGAWSTDEERGKAFGPATIEGPFTASPLGDSILARAAAESLTVPSAIHDVRHALADYEGLSAAVSAARDAWDRESASKRPSPLGEYAEHRERLDSLARATRDAETAADVAKTRVLVLKEILAALVSERFWSAKP